MSDSFYVLIINLYWPFQQMRKVIREIVSTREDAAVLVRQYHEQYRNDSFELRIVSKLYEILIEEDTGILSAKESIIPEIHFMEPKDESQKVN